MVAVAVVFLINSVPDDSSDVCSLSVARLATTSGPHLLLLSWKPPTLIFCIPELLRLNFLCRRKQIRSHVSLKAEVWSHGFVFPPGKEYLVQRVLLGHRVAVGRA